MFLADELSCIKVVPRDEGSSIDVTLRCDLAITGESIPLKAIGFIKHIKPDKFRAKLVLMHMGCQSCERGLELLCA